MGTDPAGVTEKKGSDGFFYRILEAGNVGDESGGGEERENGVDEFGESGGRRAKDDEVGVGGERGGCADFGLRKEGADGGNGFGATGDDGDFGFGKSLGGGEGDGSADESGGEDGDFCGTHFWVGRTVGRSSSSRDICSGVPMEIRIQVGRW